MFFKRSILLAVSLAYVASLACGFFVAHFIADKSYDYYVVPTFRAMDRLELEEARSAFQAGGSAALATYLGRLDHAFGGQHFLLRSDGTDVLSGRSQAGLLPEAPETRFRGYNHGVFRLAQRSDDGRYWFAVLGTSNETGPATWAYFAVCIIVTTGLLVFSLLYLVFPLRRIRDALGSFGRARTEMRVKSTRQDEIGQLAATFNAMAERVEQSFRTERSLLEDVSHELRAPLSRMTLAIHLAKKEHPSALLSQIETNAQKLSLLVGEITEFHQRWSAGENVSPAQAVDLEELVRDAVRDAQLEASSRSIVMDMRTVPVTLHNARPELVRRVLENILRNAIIHSRQGERIEIRMTSSYGKAFVTVRDFGVGVAPEHLERIFDPFYREQKSSDERNGLGLGLSIARRGMQWHDGTLEAENAFPGLRLTARFPASEKDMSAGEGR